MAGCTNICKPNKYTQDELRRFIDRVENVLQHQECRTEYIEFLKEIRRPEQIKLLKVWKLTNDIIENRPDTPELVPKIETLQNLVENIPHLVSYSDKLEGDNLTILRNKVCQELTKSHKLFSRQLLKKYK